MSTTTTTPSPSTLAADLIDAVRSGGPARAVSTLWDALEATPQEQRRALLAAGAIAAATAAAEAISLAEQALRQGPR